MEGEPETTDICYQENPSKSGSESGLGSAPSCSAQKLVPVQGDCRPKTRLELEASDEGQSPSQYHTHTFKIWSHTCIAMLG